MLALSGWSLFAKESEDKVSGVIKTVTGKNPADIKQDARVSLNVPTIAESGANVPVKITVNIPVKDVKSVHVFVDNNPTPHIMGINFSEMSGEAYLEARVRFAKSSAIRGVAILNDGSAIMDQKEVKVTVGGCG